jgi:hypothetical protein
MYAVAHGGRDSSLGSDDRDGILSIYPSSGSSGGGGGTGGGGTGGGGTGGGGGGTGGGGGVTPLSITTVFLPSVTAGRAYSQSLSATGGTPPYKWILISGIPLGLTLSVDGVIQGTTSRTGTYSVFVQVLDQGGATATQRIGLEVLTSGPITVPQISRVKVKKNKKVTIFGLNFRQDAVVILNGLVLTPEWFEKDGDTTSLFVRQSVGPAGTNLIFVQNPDNRSQAFIF